MANIVITAVPAKNYHKIHFGTYAAKVGCSQEFFWTADIKRVTINQATGIVELFINGDQIPLLLSFDGITTSMIVDSVATVAPESNSDLADKLANLRG